MVSHTIIYYHRIHFPASSGQTIQVIRDYYAMSRLNNHVHVFYRAPGPYDRRQVLDALSDYGADDPSRFDMHCVVEGWFGKWRTQKKVEGLVKGSEFPVVLVVRTLDHAVKALRIRNKFPRRHIVVILELHETAIPHMVYTEYGRPLKAVRSKKTEKAVFSRVDGILCTVPSQLEILGKMFPDHASTAVLPNSYDANRYKGFEKETATDTEGFHIRYAGQFNTWKNTGILIEMLRFLPENVVLDIAGGKGGDGSAGERELKRLEKDQGVHSRVNYVGFLPPVKVADFLRGGDCLVLPLGNNIESRFFTSPMKLFEYAASGVPMIVTRQPTTLSLIQENVHALMVDPEQPEDMANAVKRIVADAKLAKSLAANARKWVAQYASDKRAAKYQEFIETVFARL